MKKNLITGLVLASFALICGLLLAVVNYFTAPVIEERTEETIKESLYTVCEDYKNNPDAYTLDSSVTHEEYSDIVSIYLLKNNSTEKIDYAIYVVDNQGYASTIEMMICVDSDHKVAGYTVISSSETKGDIKSYASEDGFDMMGESTMDEFDKLAGSSISSKAVRKCFNTALYASYDDIK